MNFPSPERQKTEQPVSLKRPSQGEFSNFTFEKSLLYRDSFLVSARHGNHGYVLGYLRRMMSGRFAFEKQKNLPAKLSKETVLREAKQAGIIPFMKEKEDPINYFIGD